MTTDRYELYKQGLNDVEIAAALGMTKGAICHWRNSRGLPPHKSFRVSEQENAKRMMLYNLGYTDVAAAKILGITRHSFYMWRKARSLPSKIAPGEKRVYKKCYSKDRMMTRGEALVVAMGHWKFGEDVRKLAREHNRPVQVIRWLLQQIEIRNPWIANFF